MTLAYPDAASWAQGRSRSETPRLGMLEAVAFQSHPEVVAALGPDGAAVARILSTTARSTGARARDAVLVPVGILAMLSPIVGMAVLGSSQFLDPLPSYQGWLDARTSVPIAVTAFAVTAAALLVAGIGWLVRGARWSGVLFGFAILATFCALMSLVSIPTVAERDAYPLPAATLVPVWAAVGLGLLLAVAALIRFRVRAPEEPEPPHPGSPDGAAGVMAGVPREELTAILADRDAALRTLAERGFIGEDLLREALAAPPGTLFTLDADGRTNA